MKSWTAPISSVIALVAVMTGAFGPLGLTLAVAFAFVAAFGIGWPHYLGIPAKKTLAAVIALSGGAGIMVAAFSSAPNYLRWLPAVMAVGVAAVFVVQLLRGTGQSHRLESTLGASVGVILATLGAGWIADQRFLETDKALLLISGVSALVALLVGLIRWPNSIVAPVGVVLAALAGAMAALLFSDVHIVPAAVVGVAVAAVLLSFRSLTVVAGPAKSIAGGIAMGLAPVICLGTLVYFIDKLLIS
ncbi:MAG: permease [Acidobacteria bacterium]|nr:permease [Acidobacteriota bacterium]